jgi:hypothetical protein
VFLPRRVVFGSVFAVGWGLGSVFVAANCFCCGLGFRECFYCTLGFKECFCCGKLF